MAPAYKVEELLALRDSVSESAVSLDKFADEDVIKGKRQTCFHPSPLTSYLLPLTSPTTRIRQRITLTPSLPLLGLSRRPTALSSPHFTSEETAADSVFRTRLAPFRVRAVDRKQV